MIFGGKDTALNLKISIKGSSVFLHSNILGTKSPAIKKNKVTGVLTHLMYGIFMF
jgi:hypothetical protein